MASALPATGELVNQLVKLPLSRWATRHGLVALEPQAQRVSGVTSAHACWCSRSNLSYPSTSSACRHLFQGVAAVRWRCGEERRGAREEPADPTPRPDDEEDH